VGRAVGFKGCITTAAEPCGWWGSRSVAAADEGFGYHTFASAHVPSMRVRRKPQEKGRTNQIYHWTDADMDRT
jgi:hypothetical protein